MAEKKMAGREYMGTVRTTFVTDTDHRITHIITKVDTKKPANSCWSSRQMPDSEAITTDEVSDRAFRPHRYHPCS